MHKILFQILCSFGYTKMSVDLNMYFFQMFKSYQIYLFCVANNTKNFTLKICMFVGYIIDYTQKLISFFFKKYDK
jgi:hypothetical protein